MGNAGVYGSAYPATHAYKTGVYSSYPSTYYSGYTGHRVFKREAEADSQWAYNNVYTPYAGYTGYTGYTKNINNLSNMFFKKINSVPEITFFVIEMTIKNRYFIFVISTWLKLIFILWERSHCNFLSMSKLYIWK